MASRAPIAALALLAVLAAAGGGGVAAAQLSEQEAFQLFQQLGCIGCHNGRIARSWDQMLSDLERVQTEFGGDLDAYARSIEYTLNPNIKFNTWEDLKRQMASNVGRDPGDPDIERIFSFLESVALGAPPEEQTTTPPAMETTPPAEETTTPAAEPEPEPAEPAEGVPLGLAAAVAAVILAVLAGLVYFLARRK